MELDTLESRFGNPMLRTFEDIEQAEAAVPVALWPYFLYPPDGQLYVPSRGDAPGPAVLAFVNRGRWIARCPFCPSAQHVSQDDPRFFCATCLNAGAGNLTVPVVWPGDPDTIEQVLLERPFVTTQNWVPPETVDDLIAENQVLGDAS